MAYDFNGTTANLEIGSALVSSPPLTIFARFVFDTIAAGNASIASITGNAGTHAFQLRRNGAALQAVASEGATTEQATTAGIFLAGDPYVAAAVFASSTSRTIYHGTTGSINDTAPVTPASLNRTNVGARYNAGALGAFFDGQIREVAFWNVALTEAEFITLWCGASPALVRPASLVGYFPLIRDLNDRKAQRAFTATAATVTPHGVVRNPPSRRNG